MKDFSSANTERVYNKIEQGTARKRQQGTASPEEVRRRTKKLKTQGRKGCKAARINMAFSADNYEFIRVMSKATGNTMTKFTNIILDAYREEHPEFMEQAHSFLDLVNSRTWGAKKNTDKTETEEGTED